MLPFCGYNFGDYFAHWLSLKEREGVQLPRLFYVNWFRKGDDGHFLWPGFGDNSRVLKWVLGRIAGEADGTETAIGIVPSPSDLDTSGLGIDDADVELLLSVDADEWRRELALIQEHYDWLGERLPDELRDQLTLLEKRLAAV
jgi:phosphoenolpyruvate carboxykinase (GTP)